MIEPKLYIPGQNQAADALVKLYENISASPIAEALASGEERPAKDPFGLNNAPALTDDYEAGKAGAVRFTKFFALLVQDFTLAPKVALFMAELTFLNIFNSDNIPLSEADIEDARKAAFKYYSESLSKVPSLKR